MISGSFDQSEAKDLALVLRYGSLPVNLEAQTVQTVSATLGEDSLRAGLIAGMRSASRWCASTCSSTTGPSASSSSWASACGAGSTTRSSRGWAGAQGLALSLAGVTGLVVSVGVTVDSYVVYFERLKDEIAAGRPLRASTERAFKRSVAHDPRRQHLQPHRCPSSSTGSPSARSAASPSPSGWPPRSTSWWPGSSSARWSGCSPAGASSPRTRCSASCAASTARRRAPLRGRGGPGGRVGAARRFARLYHGETSIDFVGRFRRWILISGVVIVIGGISFGVRGLNLGIDFEGGSVWEVPAHDLSVQEAQGAVEGAGLEGVTVQTLEADGDGPPPRGASASVDADKAQEITSLLAEETGADTDEVSLTSVGPSWGDEISSRPFGRSSSFLIVITLYITFRFEIRMAIPTLVALVHDILVTVGVYSVFGFEVTPATVIALLTILGFSIYDGIVVFDKVDENTPLVGSKEDLSLTRWSTSRLNQVLMRSLNTSITALLPVASLLLARLVRARREHARGVRLGPPHRPVRRRLLVDLHRLADAGRAQGASPSRSRRSRSAWPCAEAPPPPAPPPAGDG